MIDTGKKNFKSPIKKKAVSIERELGQQLVRSVFKNQQKQTKMATKANTTSLTSDFFMKKSQALVAKKVREYSLPKKSVSPAKGSTAITDKKRYVSPYSKKAVE